MHRLIRLVEAGRITLKPLFTHRFGLDEISSAYDLFASRRDGVLKVAVVVN
jgi:threonine dehydrogenase-like Zn-dependent dehydrogenase